MVDAVGATSLNALRARMMSASGAQAQANATAVAAASRAALRLPASALPATPAYPRGSVQAENVRMALGMSKAARTNIETLNIGVGSYNGAARLLADTAKIEDLRKRGGDKAVDIFIRGHQQIQRGALLMMNGAAGKMQQEFTITGTALSKAEDGSFKVGSYTQSAGEDGWSVAVKSTGQVKAVANGVDVSSQVDDSSSSGFKWSSLGQSVNIAA